MAPVHDLIHHGDGVIGVADDALALAVQGQLLAAQDVFPGALTLCLEIPGRADIRPLNIRLFGRMCGWQIC